MKEKTKPTKTHTEFCPLAIGTKNYLLKAEFTSKSLKDIGSK